MADVPPDEDAPSPSDRSLSIEEALDELVSIVEKAKSMPLSSSAIISRDEVLDLLVGVRDALPVELHRARRLLQDHDELRIEAQRDAEELLDEARAQAAHLVQRTEVVRQARHQADRIVEDGEAEARRIRHEADDYVDRKLAAFEIVLDRTMRTVQAGRERLSVVPELDEDGEPSLDPEAVVRPDDGFFDQDLS